MKSTCAHKKCFPFPATGHWRGLSPAIWFLLAALLFFVSSCAESPIRRVYLEHAARDVSIPVLQANPGLYKGRLFLLGGIIVNTTVTDEGSNVYAIYVPVDPDGIPQPSGGAGGRYIAIWPKSNGTLDPLVYKKNLEITVAGEFVGLRKGRLDKTGYDYPVFRIEQIYLWRGEEYQPYYYPYYGYPYSGAYFYGYPYYPHYYPYYSYPYYNYPYYRNYYYRGAPYYYRR